MAYSLVPMLLATPLLLAGAIWDIRRRRIPNAISLAVAAAGLVYQAACRGWGPALAGLAIFLGIMGALWVPWATGRLGGGDVKLAAAAGIWLGYQQLPHYVLAWFLLGGIAAIVCYGLSSVEARREVRTNLLVLVSTGRVPQVAARGTAGRVSVPLGAAAAAGALLVLWTGMGLGS